MIRCGAIDQTALHTTPGRTGFLAQLWWQAGWLLPRALQWVEVVSARGQSQRPSSAGLPSPWAGRLWGPANDLLHRWLLFSPFTILGGGDQVGLL